MDLQTLEAIRADLAQRPIHDFRPSEDPQLDFSKRNALISPLADFWMLGGASIFLWALFSVSQIFRTSSDVIHNRFLQLGALFSIMTIFCNHPHFMISYRFGYGRGLDFVFKNWIRLILLPAALFLFYLIAYLKFHTQVDEWAGVVKINSVLAKTGWSFRLGTLSNLGTEILSFSVLAMNLTVGWHYSKQVFGCCMVYARFTEYPLSFLQRRLLKASLFSVAFFNFFYLSIYAPEYSSNTSKEAYFFNIPVLSLGLPTFLIPVSAAAVIVLVVAVVVFIVLDNFKKYRRWPHPNLTVAWLAFYVWWAPIFRQSEYYFLAVPFFHSLQYLPFAYRLEESRFSAASWREVRISARVAVLLATGFAMFELFPNMLDNWLGSYWFIDTYFFMVTFAIFINLHHFLIDSVVWKFNEAEVKRGIFCRE